MEKLNDREYRAGQFLDPTKPHPETKIAFIEQFIRDLLAEARKAPAIVDGQVAESVRTFQVRPVFPALEIGGVKMEVVNRNGGDVIPVLWSLPRRDGSYHLVEIILPEEVRAQMASTTLQGDTMITSVFAVQLPQVLAFLAEEWGVPFETVE